MFLLVAFYLILHHSYYKIAEFQKDQSSDLTVFDETLVKRWLKQIIILEDHFTVELKSGLKIEIKG